MIETEWEQKRERRYSPRWPCCKSICYRQRGHRRVFEAQLCERSLNGLVIVGAPGQCARAGAYLVPADDRSATRHGFRLGYVCRTSVAKEDQQRMYVEILA